MIAADLPLARLKVSEFILIVMGPTAAGRQRHRRSGRHIWRSIRGGRISQSYRQERAREKGLIATRYIVSRPRVASLCLWGVLSACSGGGGGPAPAAVVAPEIGQDDTAQNTAPTISGSPQLAVNVSADYSFTPTGEDVDGDGLTFMIANQPLWASFDPAAGTLSGTPSEADVGTYPGIEISVSDGTATTSLPAFDLTVVALETNNTPPNISGSSQTTVSVSVDYSFTPTVDDADGDGLTFMIANQPPWARFDPATGTLSGTPAEVDVGTYFGIQISVSDGVATAALSPFDVTVVAVANGSATLTWTAPTRNEDGSALNDLAGYKFYYGTTLGDYPNVVEVSNPGISSYIVGGLAPGTWYFVATAFDHSGNESKWSNEASKTVP